MEEMDLHLAPRSKMVILVATSILPWGTSNGIAMGTGSDGMDVSASGVIVGTLAVMMLVLPQHHNRGMK